MNKAPLVTKEEVDLVKDVVLLPIVLDVLERDIRTLRTLELKMPAVYISKLRRVQDEITRELTTVRRRLRESGLKVYEQERTALGVEAGYLCRGYEHRFSMLWRLTKAEIRNRLCRYLQLDITTLVDVESR